MILIVTHDRNSKFLTVEVKFKVKAAPRGRNLLSDERIDGLWQYQGDESIKPPKYRGKLLPTNSIHPPVTENYSPQRPSVEPPGSAIKHQHL